MKTIIKTLYRILVKPLLNVITLRYIRKKFARYIRHINDKRNIYEIEKKLPDNAVLIFQHQFYDTKGEKCFNGGAERYVADLSEILHKKNYTPYLIQMAKGKYFFKQLNNMHVIGMPAVGIGHYQTLCNMFKKYRFVIYSGATNWGGKLLHPNVLISHGITWDKPNKNININAILNIFRDVDNFVSVDTNTISWLRTTFAKTMFGKKMAFIPNYVDTKLYKPIQKKNKHLRIVFPRRASPERGYWLMSKALPAIMDKYTSVEFEFVGFAHGSEIESDLKRLCNLYPNRIKHYVVEPDQMVQVYQNADISLVPTEYSEGTSLSCLEAQACGNVVIATNVGGLPNLIFNGYNGLIINPNECELQNALDYLLKSPKIMKALSEHAVEVAKAFDKSNWVKSWGNVIEEVFPE